MPATRPDYRLDTRGALGVVTGSMVGVGIFLAPAEMAAVLSAPGWFLGVWALGAVGAACGAAAYAALGEWHPASGGDLVYQEAAFGRGIAFATGHLQFFAAFCGSAAVIAAALGQYQLQTLTGLPLGEVLVELPLLGDITGARLVGVAVVLGLTAVQVRGLRVADRVQRALAMFPVVALTVLAVATLLGAALGSIPAPTPPPAPLPLSAGALVTAWLAAHFAYSGWNAVAYLAGELQTPGRTLWRAMLGGTAAVGALYLLICGAFVVGLGMGGLAEAGEAGTALANRVAGPLAGRAMNALIAVGLLGTVHATLLGGAQVARAMAASGSLPASFAALDANRTPRRALWLQGVWTAGLVLAAGAEVLLAGVALVMVLVGTLTVAALFQLRWRHGAAGPGTPAQLAMAAVHFLTGVAVLGVELHGALDQGRLAPLFGLGAMVVLAVVGTVWARVRREVPGR